MPWVKVWIHFVWSTKNREPYLTDEIRQEIFRHIRSCFKTVTPASSWLSWWHLAAISNHKLIQFWENGGQDAHRTAARMAALQSF